MAWRSRAVLFLILVATGTIVAGALGEPLWTGAGIAAGAGFVCVAILTVPNAIAVGTILLFYFILVVPLGAFFVSAPFGEQAVAAPDIVGGTVGLSLSVAFAVWVGVRWGRGRAWFTVLLLVASTILLGIPLVMAYPALGLNAARLSLIVVLLWRCGGFYWALGAAGIVVDRLRKRGRVTTRPATVDDMKAIRRWYARGSTEHEVFTILRRIPNVCSWFRVRLPNAPGPVSSVAITRSGMILVECVEANGPISETPHEGVQVPGVKIGEVAAALFGQRHELVRALKCSTKDTEMIVIVGGAEKGTRTRLGVHKGSHPIPVATVLLISPDMLDGEIRQRRPVWGKLTRKMAHRRLLARSESTPVPVPTNAAEASSASSSGDNVILSTTLGNLTGVRLIEVLRRPKISAVNASVTVEQWWTEGGPIPEVRTFMVPENSLQTAV